MERDTKGLVLKVLQEAYPGDLSILEAAGRAGVARNTASTWIRVLVAEGLLESTRDVGNAKMFRLKKR